MLRDPEDPRGAERLFATEKKLVSAAGARPGPGGICPAAFDQLIRRGLLEVDFRKLARLTNDYTRRRIDPLFDPGAPPPVTFKELTDQHLEIETDEAGSNNTSLKSLDRKHANIALLRQLVGDDSLVSALDYDACQEVCRRLACVPTNLTKSYRGLTLREAIECADEERRERLAPITQSQYLADVRRQHS